ncbi:MFS transporter [Microlunatus soli]|uniref:MFS transporter, CP family, cyanate transporter n=1 Tax=Microlunatus soli TaxID=630515 RepID=A0A1H1UDH7_9ACTN|nr:MFS transporter [Microlunatus soli]SDS70564.1 MFS transporter, CP family, cyanate transporter [Microlunatus soli]
MTDPDLLPDDAATLPRRRGRAILAVIGVLLVAACLRPAITSVGPVLHRIGVDVGIGPGLLGLLAALPLLAFAVVSPLAHLLARRVGTDRAVLAALIMIIIGLAARSLAVPGLLWIGTLIIGIGIAIGNVLVPAVVKRDFPGHISPMTGGYTATMNTFAATASGISVPIAALAIGGSSGWRGSVGIWLLPAAAAMIIWAVRMRLVEHPTAIVPAGIGDHDRRRQRLWRSALAWQVTLHMGLQSTVFYTLVNWLPAIEAEHGTTAAAAGSHLFLYQAVGIAAAFAVTVLMGRRDDQRGIAIMVALPMLIALTGLLLWPDLVVIWAVLGGMTSGSSVALALAMMGLRTGDPADTARLSGMAQGFGYLLAAGGPIAAGSIRELTGSWSAVIIILIALTLLQATVGRLAGRDRVIGTTS